ncbi:Pkinase-domain-containing protein [Ramaria rubella]|nr:Pkinase-domain-containing protein [Ramaria rubella]
MTTFGLPAASGGSDFELVQSHEDHASIPMPGIQVAPASVSLPNDTSGALLQADTIYPDNDDDDDDDEEDEEVYRADSDFVPTQQQTQSQHCTYDPELDQHLVGLLIPSSDACPQFELAKSKDSQSWKIGRHHQNDLVLPGLRLSNFHGVLTWNGQPGQRSEVTLEDRSSNGTWVNNTYIKKGQKCVLRSGAAISFGASPEVPNDYRFIFRDIEGQSTRHANQIWAKYDVSIELGAGAYARVYKCILRATGKEFAVKVIGKEKLRRSGNGEMAVVREIQILQQLADFHHKNIVTLHEYFEETDSIYLILELVRGGDLLTYLGAHGPIPEGEVRRMAAQICHAVASFHSQGITHRDLKPENILMTATTPPDCKVADFGLAKLVDDQTFLKTVCGTPAYLAPEVVLRAHPNQAYDSRVDSWSLGIIFFCMLTNLAPFREVYDPQASDAQRQQYFGERRVDWSSLEGAQVSEDCNDFLRNLLREDPRNRKSVLCMLDHPWISPLLPADAQFQRTRPSSTPSTPDGLSSIGREASDPVNGTTVFPQTKHQEMESMISEVSVTAKIPAVEEAVGDNPSWEFVVPPLTPGAPGPSRQTPEPNGLLGKRKSHLIAGSSPLSSLSSDEESETERKKPVSRRSAPRRSKGKAVDNKRKPLPRRSSKDGDEEYGVRNTKNGRRQPPAKAARHA